MSIFDPVPLEYSKSSHLFPPLLLFQETLETLGLISQRTGNRERERERVNNLKRAGGESNWSQ